MKVIIAGSRDVFDYELLSHLMVNFEVTSKCKVTEVVCGCAKGVDEMGKEWAKEHDIPVKLFPANWNKHGKTAGPRRNIEMGNYADALVAIRKNMSRGTTHMIKYMESLGKHILVVDIPNDTRSKS